MTMISTTDMDQLARLATHFGAAVEMRGTDLHFWRGNSYVTIDTRVIDRIESDELWRDMQRSFGPAEVVPLRPERPLLSDIPAMLRRMADQIEQGEIKATTVLLVIPRDGDWPDLFCHGEHMGGLANIATMELAKLWFANNLTVRQA